MEPAAAQAWVTIVVLSFSSRYIFFRRRFSSSSYFIQAIMDTSMPPDFTRHL
jgi:hypothetical protein